MRESRKLLLNSRKFAKERRLTSWWCLISSLTVFVLFQAIIVSAQPMLLRLAASVLAGMTIIRLFVIYHDYEHGTILKRSRAAWLLMKTWGVLTLNAPSIWRRSHDHHHKHNAKMHGASIGSFPVMTVDQYRSATPGGRRRYRASRHPLTLAFGYLTVFLYGMSIRSLLTNPRQHADSALAIAVHAVLIVLLAWAGIDFLILCLLLPMGLATMLGAYLFYAQHNFPDAHIQPDKKWDFATAAIRSSSYMKMGRIMAWFTGNIGYHHVHHLNHHIPFYRLPEALLEMPELDAAGVTSLWPGDVMRCLRLKLWDTRQQQLVPYPKSLPRTESAGNHPPSVQDGIRAITERKGA